MIRVALTMRITGATGYPEPRDSISHDWLALLAEWDMSPLLVPNIVNSAASYLDGLDPDLLVFTGGDDLGTMPERDAVERTLFDHALARGLPTLGVCRGMQLVNDIQGGRTEKIEGHVATAHGVTVEPSWRAQYDVKTEVNSYHGLGIAPGDLGADLEAGAVDAEGYIEALFHREKPVAAIMWHPERAGAPANDRAMITRLAEQGAFWR